MKGLVGTVSRCIGVAERVVKWQQDTALPSTSPVDVLALVLAVMSAPASSSACDTPTSTFFQAAKCSGVNPSCTATRPQTPNNYRIKHQASDPEPVTPWGSFG